LDDDLLLHLARQFVPNFVRSKGTVEEQRGPLGSGAEHVDLEQIVKFVHANEACRLEEIRRMNGLRTETQMRDRIRAGLLGVIDKVALRIPTGFGGQD